MAWGTPRMMLVRTTVGNRPNAEALADRLVEAGAACVHIHEVQSRYVWKGKPQLEPEWMVEARTTMGGEDVARQVIAQGHPYEVPLIESWRVEVSQAYAEWAAGEKR